jgi:HK97 gp10 family phage protein
MTNSVTITTKGLNKILTSLKKFPAELKSEVNMEFAEAAKDVRREAVKNAPADEAGLRLSIQTQQVGNNHEVTVGKAYGPFVEFGTKRRFRATPGFESYAQQFKGKKIPSAGTLDDAILAWVKRKRIKFEKEGKSKTGGTRYLTPEQTAFVIARHISFHGIRPHPYLFPAFVRVRRELTKKITQAIRRSFE